MVMKNPKIYGLIAEFESSAVLLEAARRAYEAGYRRMDAYTPFPVDGLPQAIGARRSWLPLIVLTGGVLGAAGGYFLQYYGSVIDYPLNVGGRPLHSWPAFIPIAIELSILAAALAALFGLLMVTGLPTLHHPVFNVPGFEMATRTHFFLAIEARDPRYDPQITRRFLESLGAREVEEIEY